MADDADKTLVDPRTGAVTRRIRPFADFLREHRQGGLHDEIGQSLNELVEAVSIYRKAGTMTVTIEVKPVGRGGNVVLVDDVKVKPPRGDRPEALFFIDEEFNLTRSDPRQAELPFKVRTVPRPEAAEAPAGEEVP